MSEQNKNELELRDKFIAPAISQANSIVIATAQDYSDAGEVVRNIKSAAKKTKEYWKKPIEAANEAHKALTAKRAEMLKPLTEAEGIIKQKMIAYQNSQEQIRLEAERKAEEEAAKLQRKAMREAKKGNEEAAQELAVQSAMVQANVNYETPVAGGTSMKDVWKFRVIDANKVPREYLMINEKLLNDLAKATKGKLPIDGIEFYSEKAMSVRSK